MEGMKSMKKKSDSYYDKAWRWVEDTYLKYFGENRTSYGVKGKLSNSEVLRRVVNVVRYFEKGRSLWKQGH
jgi:hypothetical protein